MVYAYDQWAQMPTIDLYDTQMMSIAINAAKDMYEKGQQQIKEFNSTYGDFITPIAKDQDYYNKNVLDPVRNTIEAIYAAGGDPLRSPEARALISRAINSVNSGEVSKLKQSAENAREFLKAKQKLELQGLYNPLYSKYDHPDMSTYSTLGPEGSGIWEKLSPTPYQNIADFSKSYFDNIKPITRSASKNGISYTKSEITKDDLHNIADAHFNDLVNTPQGQLMYKKLLDDFNGDKEAARNAFNDTVVSGNTDRLFYQDNYDDNWFKRQTLNLQREQLALKKQIAGQKNNVDSGATGWTQRRYFDSALAYDRNQAAVQQFNEWREKNKDKKIINKDKTSGTQTVAYIQKGDLYNGANRNVISDYYRACQHKPSVAESKTADEIFAQGAADTKYGTSIGKTNNKTTTNTEKTFVSFADENIRPTAIAETMFAGRRLNKNGITTKFSKYLEDRRIEGEIIGSPSVNALKVGNSYIIEVNKNVRVNKEDLVGFCGKEKEEFKKRIEKLRLKGVGKVDKDGLYDYYDIPSSRRIELNEEDAVQLNKYDEKNTYNSMQYLKNIGLFENELDL